MTDFDKEFDAGDFSLDEPDFYDESSPYWTGGGVAEYNNIPLIIELISVFDVESVMPQIPSKRKATADYVLPRSIKDWRGNAFDVTVRTDYRGVMRNKLGHYVGAVRSLRKDLKISRGHVYARVKIKSLGGERGWVRID